MREKEMIAIWLNILTEAKERGTVIVYKYRGWSYPVDLINDIKNNPTSKKHVSDYKGYISGGNYVREEY